MHSPIYKTEKQQAFTVQWRELDSVSCDELSCETVKKEYVCIYICVCVWHNIVNQL